MWEEKLALYDALVARHSAFERKGKTMPYTSANGHMFSQLNKVGELGIRLPKEEREAFLEKYQTPLFTAYNTIMKEYVLVPAHLQEDLEQLSPYLEMAYLYVMSLPKK